MALIKLGAPSIFIPPSQHSTLQAPPAPIKEDACSEHMLSYINKADIDTALEQAHSKFKQD
ncbi:hypothetical protein C0995_009817 [Termitomyces sp. Mi166|nr:hypothetical protein C0995_009817 [Termitomyces sp. Mi166\